MLLDISPALILDFVLLEVTLAHALTSETHPGYSLQLVIILILFFLQSSHLFNQAVILCESGYSGISGFSGYSGISGYSSFSGYSGISGYSGFSGISGYSGFSGISGFSGASGVSSNYYYYKANTSATSGDPGSDFLLWNNSTQISSTQLNVSNLAANGVDISVFLALLEATEEFVVQDQINSANSQTWLITGSPTKVGTYWTIPVSYVSSSGTGTTNFSNNQSLILAIANGISGFSGLSGYSGYSGFSGISGFSGFPTDVE